MLCCQLIPGIAAWARGDVAGKHCRSAMLIPSLQPADNQHDERPQSARCNHCRAARTTLTRCWRPSSSRTSATAGWRCRKAARRPPPASTRRSPPSHRRLGRPLARMDVQVCTAAVTVARPALVWDSRFVPACSVGSQALLTHQPLPTPVGGTAEGERGDPVWRRVVRQRQGQDVRVQCKFNRSPCSTPLSGKWLLCIWHWQAVHRQLKCWHVQSNAGGTVLPP